MILERYFHYLYSNWFFFSLQTQAAPPSESLNQDNALGPPPVKVCRTFSYNTFSTNLDIQGNPSNPKLQEMNKFLGKPKAEKHTK